MSPMACRIGCCTSTHSTMTPTKKVSVTAGWCVEKASGRIRVRYIVM